MGCGCKVDSCTSKNIKSEIINARTPLTGKHWIVDQKGCWHFNPKPMPNEKLEWTGGCSEGVANGYGLMHWFSNGQASSENSSEKVLQIGGFSESSKAPLSEIPASSHVEKFLVNVPEVGYIFLNFQFAQQTTKAEIVSRQPYIIRFISGNVTLATYTGDLCQSSTSGNSSGSGIFFPIGGTFTIADGTIYRVPFINCQNIKSDRNIFGNTIYYIGAMWREYNLVAASPLHDLALKERSLQIENDEKNAKAFKLAYDRGACSEAQKIAAANKDNNQIYYNHSSCESNSYFLSALNSKDPQNAYLAAVKMENDGDRSRAKTVYLRIMSQFATSPIAVRAADRLARLADVTAIENAQSNAAAAIQRANSDAAQRDRKACEAQRNACFVRCDSLSSTSARSTCTNGCIYCGN